MQAKAKITANLSVINYREMLIKYAVWSTPEFNNSPLSDFFTQAEIDELNTNILPEANRQYMERVGLS